MQDGRKKAMETPESQKAVAVAVIQDILLRIKAAVETIAGKD